MQARNWIWITGLFYCGYAAAEVQRVAVVPVGTGHALAVSAEVAQQLAKEATVTGRREVRVYYPAPTPPKYRVGRAMRRAHLLLRQAENSFKGLEFDAVRTKVKAALKIIKAEMRRGADSSDYVHALRLLAAAELFDGNQEAAFGYMNDAFLQDPTPPSKKKFNPNVQALYRKVSAAKGYTGKLQFKLASGGLAFFNQRQVGAASGQITLRAGLYLLRVLSPGHRPWDRWVRVAPSQTREVAVDLKRGTFNAPPIIAALAAETSAEAPGATSAAVAQAAQVDEVIIVASKGRCRAKNCPLSMHWARDGKWFSAATGTYIGNAAELASSWAAAGAQLARAAPTPAAGSQPAQPPTAVPECKDDGACFPNGRCVGGRCKRNVPLTKKWWFWALVGVGATAAGAAIIIPLATASTPVIEVR